MEIIGYARVSTREQNLDMQLDALRNAGCEHIFTEKMSGVKERPELNNALGYLRKGDVLVIWKLDRLGRSLKDLVTIIDSLQKKGISFKSIMDGIDTQSPLGRCQFGIFASLAEYERELIKERTMAGLQAARNRGKIGGRKKGLTPEAKNKAKTARLMYDEYSAKGELSILDICKTLGIKSKATLYRYLKHEGVELVNKKKE